MLPSVTKRLKEFIAVISSCVLFANSAHAEIVWHWEDRFTDAEQNMLTEWIQITVAAIEKRVTAYPFDVHIYFHRRRAGEPVPWANTERGTIQGVHFHVDTRYPQEEFLADWTAPHELSHLLIPYLGRSRAWFAEGFASFMQYQVMHEMGVLNQMQIMNHYQTHVKRAASNYALHDVPFAIAAPRLHRQREYATMYWGGATYFLQVDRALRKDDKSMVQVLRKFVDCCRNDKYKLDQLVDEFDRQSSSTVFSETLRKFKEETGFPSHVYLFEQTSS